LCFVSHAGGSGIVNGAGSFCFAISRDVESGELVGCPGAINLTCRDDGSQNKNEGTHLASPLNGMRKLRWTRA
jgi:hypothetical protein